ncbi:MAG: tryptophan-5-halogenase [Chthoniobacteraceae bacterium]|nr:tryptophan-5-halogenase [Chthoniobacteraceae bacterium]
MIENVLVLGSGSAGLIAAISLKRKIPRLSVRVVRSKEIGVIGVGEGTTVAFPKYFFEYLGISQRLFYEKAEPTWKLGIRFLWGPRDHFDYTFSNQLDSRWRDLSFPNGYYCEKEFRCIDIPAALMAHDKAFARQPNGTGPIMEPWFGFHIENKKLVEVLEFVACQLGVEIIEGKVSGAERGPEGIAAVQLEDGRRLEADLFIDSSGFRSELLGRVLEEPYISYDRSLFCDRAVVGGWERTDEPILPYTVAETMNAGWSWQIEHEHHVNRGYVYASQSISDDEACAEFLSKNPKAPSSPRVVKFRSGRYRRNWVDNVVAVGNAAGFVEPLEATSLMIVCMECQTLVDQLLHCGFVATPSMRRLFNQMVSGLWDDVRDFLALHYYANTRLDTPFWRHCRADTDISGIEQLLEFYRENGPSGFGRYILRGTENTFGIEGYLVMLVGNRVPYRKQAVPEMETRLWNSRRADFAMQAKAGMDVKEALGIIRDPRWSWHGER